MKIVPAVWFANIKKFFKTEGVFYHPGHDAWFKGNLDDAVELDVKTGN